MESQVVTSVLYKKKKKTKRAMHSMWGVTRSLVWGSIARLLILSTVIKLEEMGGPVGCSSVQRLAAHDT